MKDYIELNDMITYHPVNSCLPVIAKVEGIILLDDQNGTTDGQYLNRIHNDLLNWAVLEIECDGPDSAKGWCLGEQVIVDKEE